MTELLVRAFDTGLNRKAVRRTKTHMPLHTCSLQRQRERMGEKENGTEREKRERMGQRERESARKALTECHLSSLHTFRNRTDKPGVRCKAASCQTFCQKWQL